MCQQVTTAAQQAVLGMAAQLDTEELRVHVLAPLDALVAHPEDEVGCIMVELLCSLAADVDALPVEAEALPRVLRLSDSTAYLVRKVRPPCHV